jgi:hypothetical protein
MNKSNLVGTTNRPEKNRRQCCKKEAMLGMLFSLSFNFAGLAQ